jgi:hypothetical protein
VGVVVILAAGERFFIHLSFRLPASSLPCLSGPCEVDKVAQEECSHSHAAAL